MAVTDIVIPSCIDPAFFAAKISGAKPGFWFKVCGGAAPVSGSVINLTELVPQKYAERGGNAISYNDADPRKQPVVLALFDYQQQIRRDVAAQDQGAIELDMIRGANKKVRHGDGLMVAAIAANAKSMDNAALIGTHGTGDNEQTNTVATGFVDATLTVAEADAALAGGIDAIRILEDDSNDDTSLPNTYAKSFTALTSSGSRFSKYNTAMANRNSATYVLPGYLNSGMEIQTAYLPGLDPDKDYIIINAGDGVDPAFVAGVYGDKTWAGVSDEYDVYRWYTTHNMAVVPFHWQSIIEITYTRQHS